MYRQLALVWLFVFCQLLHGNWVRRRVEFQSRSKQLAAKQSSSELVEADSSSVLLLGLKGASC